MMATQLVQVETGAGGFTAYARHANREHSATATSPDLAARLAATGLHSLQLVDVKSAERVQPRTWRVTFRHGALVQEAAR
jgi:hypothetical protein